jgi:hypothetical protein
MLASKQWGFGPNTTTNWSLNMDYQLRIRDVLAWFLAMMLLLAAMYCLPYLTLLEPFHDDCGVGIMTQNSGGFYINLVCKG